MMKFIQLTDWVLDLEYGDVIIFREDVRADDPYCLGIVKSTYRDGNTDCSWHYVKINDQWKDKDISWYDILYKLEWEDIETIRNMIWNSR